MSHSQFHSIESFILTHAWLNLWDKRMTTGRINQVTIVINKITFHIVTIAFTLLHNVSREFNFETLVHMTDSWCACRFTNTVITLLESSPTASPFVFLSNSLNQSITKVYHYHQPIKVNGVCFTKADLRCKVYETLTLPLWKGYDSAMVSTTC